MIVLSLFYIVNGDCMKKIFIFILLVSTFIIAGCDSKMFTLPVKENQQALANFGKSTVNENLTNTITIENYDSLGKKESLKYDKVPQRVVAVWQNSIETLLALGVGDKIISGNGVPDKLYFLPHLQAQYTKIPYTGLQLLDLETTMMLQPDFIVGWHSTFTPKTLRSTEFWHKRGVNTYIATNSLSNTKFKTLENEYEDILNLGKIFNKNEQAQAIVGKMRKEVGFVTERTAVNNKNPRALIIEFAGKEVNVYNEKSLAGNIVKSLHGELLAAKEHNISVEQIINYNPDVIFVVIVESYYGREIEMLNKVTCHHALKNLRCVKEKRVRALPLYEIYSSGIRTYDGIKDIAQGLYPELYRGM